MVIKSNDRLAHITSTVQIIIIVILYSQIVNVNISIAWLCVYSVY